MEKMGRMIVKLRIPILILAVILVVPSFISFMNTRVNYDILSYLPKDIDTMKGQDIMLDEFGKGGFAFVIVEGMEDNDVSKLKKEFEQIDVVEKVLWYDPTENAIPKEALPKELYDIYNAEDSTMMAVFFNTTSSDDAALDAVVEMRRLAGEQCFISGMTAVVEDIKELTMSEMMMYVIIAAVLNLIVLSIAMDSFLIPLFFLSSVGLAIIYNLGTNFIQGEISFITLALVAVLQLAVTMDYSIFLWESYKEQKKIYPDDNKEAMAAAIGKTFVSVVSSSITTVAGFLALCFMTFTLGVDLGIVMAKGVVIGVICCVTVLPAMILVFDKALTKTMHREFIPSFDKFSSFVIKHSDVFAILFIALIIPAAYGESHTSVYYNLTSTLPEDLNSVTAAAKLDEDYSMASQHILLVDTSLSQQEVTAMMDEMKQVDGVTAALSFDTVVGSRIPREMIPDSVSEIMKSDKWQMMLVGSEYEVASPEINEQIAELSSILKDYDSNGMLIGEAAATKDLIEITDNDFKTVNIMSIAFVFVIILIALKSISLPVILVSVIEFAVLVNMGISCYTHTTVPFIASVVIGTIQLGATVDYAILMTTRYKAERISGRDKHEAVSIALHTSIKSIFVSALGFFAATFGVGIYSSVDMISQLCTLLSRGAIVSMFVVNLVLPAMLMIFDRVIIATTFDMRQLRGHRDNRTKKIGTTATKVGV